VLLPDDGKLKRGSGGRGESAADAIWFSVLGNVEVRGVPPEWGNLFVRMSVKPQSQYRIGMHTGLNP